MRKRSTYCQSFPNTFTRVSFHTLNANLCSLFGFTTSMTWEYTRACVRRRSLGEYRRLSRISLFLSISNHHDDDDDEDHQQSAAQLNPYANYHLEIGSRQTPLRRSMGERRKRRPRRRRKRKKGGRDIIMTWLNESGFVVFLRLFHSSCAKGVPSPSLTTSRSLLKNRVCTNLPLHRRRSFTVTQFRIYSLNHCNWNLDDKESAKFTF